jgi:hypothetical protein
MSSSVPRLETYTGYSLHAYLVSALALPLQTHRLLAVLRHLQKRDVGANLTSHWFVRACAGRPRMLLIGESWWAYGKNL